MPTRLTDATGDNFVSGEDVIVRVQTKTAAAVLAAPTSLTFEVEIAGTAATYTLGVDAQVETIATGDYQVRAPTTAAATAQRIEVVATAVTSSYTLKHAYWGVLAVNPVA